MKFITENPARRHLLRVRLEDRKATGDAAPRAKIRQKPPPIPAWAIQRQTQRQNSVEGKKPNLVCDVTHLSSGLKNVTFYDIDKQENSGTGVGKNLSDLAQKIEERIDETMQNKPKATIHVYIRKAASRHIIPPVFMQQDEERHARNFEFLKDRLTKKYSKTVTSETVTVEVEMLYHRPPVWMGTGSGDAANTKREKNSPTVEDLEDEYWREHDRKNETGFCGKLYTKILKLFGVEKGPELQFANTYIDGKNTVFVKQDCPKEHLKACPEKLVFETVEKDFFIIPRRYRYYVVYPFASQQHKKIYNIKKPHGPGNEESCMLSADEVKEIKRNTLNDQSWKNRIIYGISCKLVNSPCTEVVQELSQQPNTSVIFEIVTVTAQVCSLLILVFTNLVVDTSPNIECYDCEDRALWSIIMSRQGSVLSECPRLSPPLPITTTRLSPPLPIRVNLLCHEAYSAR